MIEEVEGIRNEIFKVFKGIFEESQGLMLGLENLVFKQLSESERLALETKFTKEEIRSTVWELGGDKSPNLDGINFRFLQ